MADNPAALNDPTLIFHTDPGRAWQWCDTCRAVIEYDAGEPACPLCMSAWPAVLPTGTVTITGISRDAGALTATEDREDA